MYRVNLELALSDYKTNITKPMVK